MNSEQRYSLWLQFDHHRTMIRSHLILQILYITSICNNRIISPESIDTPPYIAISRSSYWIPPWVHFWSIRILFSPDIIPILSIATIEPRSLQWMESYFSIIRLRPSEIDRIMCTIDISSPEDTMPKFSKWIHIRRKLCIEYELPLPSLFGFSTIWKIDPEYIYHLSSWLVSQRNMCHSPFIGNRISWKTGDEFYSVSLKYSGMKPCTRTRISSFLRRIIVGSIWNWRIEVYWELIRSSLDLLHENNIWIIHIDQILYLSFFLDGSETIYVPGDDTHK